MAEGTPAGDGVVRAAGAVLWRPTQLAEDTPALFTAPSAAVGMAEVTLIHRPKYDDWSFPKGKLKSGEHVLRGALREVEEETGVAPRLGRRLPPSTYMKDGRPKRVDYWTATARHAGPQPDLPEESYGEVDRVTWLPIEEAERKLTYDRDVDLLHEFAAGPLNTRPIIILRHGAAGDKRVWSALDALRPLDRRGRDEAVLLADLLDSYGPARLISSATARCVETVLPYALRARAGLSTDRAFTVGETTMELARSRLDELVDDGVPTIICTHGEIVADLITELCELLGEKVPEDPTLRKSNFWVAHLTVDTAGIAALERHSPRP